MKLIFLLSSRKELNYPPINQLCRIIFSGRDLKQVQKIANQRNIARSQLVESLKPILEEYSKKNGSNIIMNTKDALYINPDLDATKQITDILNRYKGDS